MILQVYVDADTHARLRKLAKEHGKSVESLVEASVSEATLDAFRQRNDDPVRKENEVERFTK